MRADMCADVRADMCADVRADMRADMCADSSLSTSHLLAAAAENASLDSVLEIAVECEDESRY